MYLLGCIWIWYICALNKVNSAELKLKNKNKNEQIINASYAFWKWMEDQL